MLGFTTLSGAPVGSLPINSNIVVSISGISIVSDVGTITSATQHAILGTNANISTGNIVELDTVPLVGVIGNTNITGFTFSIVLPSSTINTNVASLVCDRIIPLTPTSTNITTGITFATSSNTIDSVNTFSYVGNIAATINSDISGNTSNVILNDVKVLDNVPVLGVTSVSTNGTIIATNFQNISGTSTNIHTADINISYNIELNGVSCNGIVTAPLYSPIIPILNNSIGIILGQLTKETACGIVGNEIVTSVAGIGVTDVDNTTQSVAICSIGHVSPGIEFSLSALSANINISRYILYAPPINDRYYITATPRTNTANSLVDTTYYITSVPRVSTVKLNKYN